MSLTQETILDTLKAIRRPHVKVKQDQVARVHEQMLTADDTVGRFRDFRAILHRQQTPKSRPDVGIVVNYKDAHECNSVGRDTLSERSARSGKRTKKDDPLPATDSNQIRPP